MLRQPRWCAPTAVARPTGPAPTMRSCDGTTVETDSGEKYCENGSEGEEGHEKYSCGVVEVESTGVDGEWNARTYVIYLL